MFGGALLGVLGLAPLASLAQAPNEDPLPPTVIFLLDTSRAMQEFVTWLPEAYTPGYSPTTGAKQGDLGFNDPDYGHFINTGCSDPALVAELSWFDKNSPDSSRNGSLIVDSDADLGSAFFEPQRFYFSRGRRVSWAGGLGDDTPSSVSGDFRQLTVPVDIQAACRQTWGFASAYTKNPAVLNECVACLQSKGWWRGPLSKGTRSGMQGPLQVPGEASLPPEARRKWIVSGGLLNLRPPKFVAARRVLKDVIQTASNVRMGVATLGEDRGWFDPPWFLADVRPSCGHSYPFVKEAYLDRAGLIKSVNKANPRSLERSTGEALFGLGGYFSSERQNSQWSLWFAQPVGTPGFGWPGLPSGGTYDNPNPSPYMSSAQGGTYARSSDEWFKQTYFDTNTNTERQGQRFEEGGDKRSICFHNQTTAIILVTAAEPYYEDNSVPITKMMQVLQAQGARHPTGEPLTFDPSSPQTNPNSGGVNYCDLVGGTKADCDYAGYNWPTGLAVGNKNFMDDVAFFLAHTDLRTVGSESQSRGTQSVRTYVVGYGTSHPMLQSIALAGEGGFRRADDAATLRTALEQTLAQIRAVTP